MPADYKLTDLLGSAGATIGVIIGGTIFLQFLSSKYVELAGRYRSMADEYRGRKGDEPRHGPLREEIRMYRQRLRLLIRASWLAGAALLGFLTAVLAGGLSMAFPPVEAFKWVGTGGLFLGLVLIGGAVLLEVWESVLTRHEIRDEVADLDDRARGHAA